MILINWGPVRVRSPPKRLAKNGNAPQLVKLLEQYRILHLRFGPKMHSQHIGSVFVDSLQKLNRCVANAFLGRNADVRFGTAPITSQVAVRSHSLPTVSGASNPDRAQIYKKRNAWLRFGT